MGDREGGRVVRQDVPLRVRRSQRVMQIAERGQDPGLPGAVRRVPEPIEEGRPYRAVRRQRRHDELEPGSTVGVVDAVTLRGQGRLGARTASHREVERQVREVEVEALPDAIPGHLELNVEELEVGQTLHVSDILVPEGATVLTDLGESVASVAIPKIQVEEVEEEEEAEGEEEKAEGEKEEKPEGEKEEKPEDKKEK